jgi:hypothetical protein
VKRRDANILIGMGIPAGVGLVVFCFGIFFGGAWGSSGGDMPPGSAVPNRGFFQIMMWLGGIGMALGAVLCVCSLVVLLTRLIAGPRI